MLNRLFLSILVLSLMGCDNLKESQSGNQEEKPYPTTGSIEVLDQELIYVMNTQAKIEILADGFDWTEGPLWLPAAQKVIFADIPPNKIYEWSEEDGLQLYLTPSGYTGQIERGGEVGANGLILDLQGNLVLCQHGDRRIARMNAPLNDPKADFTTISGAYNGKRLNSPNDVIVSSIGEFYFTDPPYGLEYNEKDPAKELTFQGVYKVDTAGNTSLLTDELSRPNGIALSPDEKILYVANSDPEKAIWMSYKINEDGTMEPGKIFYDATHLVAKEKGLPDGLKVTKAGYIFATGPGGVWIFNQEGKVLGKIRTGEATSNCAFNEDESVLYITADNYFMRVKLK
jgi:gluconolactonase